MDHAGEKASPIRLDFADRQVQWEGGTILAAATHFAADTMIFLTLPVVLAPIWLRHKHVNVRLQKLGRIAAKQTLGSRIDVLDEAPIIDGDDSRDRRLQNPRSLAACAAGEAV